MVTPPYPLQPEPIKKTWIERNALWKIPLGCITLLLLMAGFGILVISIVVASFRHSEVYTHALMMAKGNQQVRVEIGEPIRAGWFISGELNVNGSSGKADLSIPISGPRGHGKIRAVANKRAGVWTFTWLQVYVDGHLDAIDLLAQEQHPGT